MGQVFSRVYAETPPPSSMEEIGTGWLGPINLGTLPALSAATIGLTVPGFDSFMLNVDNSDGVPLAYRVDMVDPTTGAEVLAGTILGPFADPIRGATFGAFAGAAYALRTFMEINLVIINQDVFDAPNVVVRLAGCRR